MAPGDKPIKIDKARGALPVIGRARIFPKFPDTDALIAELRERLDAFARDLDAIKKKLGVNSDE